jgi:hypothetical protein
VTSTARFNENIVESTGLSSAESSEALDVASLWQHFDIALQRVGLIHGFDTQIERGDDTINVSWKCDSADNPSIRVDLEVSLVKAYLERSGYHRVTIVKGIDTYLAASGNLGAFHERPDPDDPHWTVFIQFDRNGDVISS